MSLRFLFIIILLYCLVAICSPQNQLWGDILRNAIQKMNKQIEQTDHFFYPLVNRSKHPLLVPTRFNNRIYKGSGINFKLSWYLPGGIFEEEKLVSQCHLFDVTSIENFYSKNCSMCFKVYSDVDNTQVFPDIWQCGSCLNESSAKYLDCNKLSTTSFIGPQSLPIISIEYFLETPPLNESGTDYACKRDPDLNVFKLYKSNNSSMNCSGTGRVLLLEYTSTDIINRRRRLAEQESEILNNVGLICRATRTINGTDFSSRPLVFMSKDLKQPEELQILMLSGVAGNQQNHPMSLNMVQNILTGYAPYLDSKLDTYMLFVMRNYAPGELMSLWAIFKGLHRTYEKIAIGGMPLITATQNGTKQIKDFFHFHPIRNSYPIAYSGLINLLQTTLNSGSVGIAQQHTIQRIGCFNWVHNKWFAVIVSNSNSTGMKWIKGDRRATIQFLGSFYGTPGDKVWDELVWSNLYQFQSNSTVVSLKCPQLGNMLVWSSKNQHNRISVVKATLHEGNGTLLFDPEVLDESVLCSCSNETILGSAAIDIVYSDVNDPYSVNLAVLCGHSSICLTSLNSEKKDCGLLQLNVHNNEKITWFQLDQSNVFMLANRSLYMSTSDVVPKSKVNSTYRKPSKTEEWIFFKHLKKNISGSVVWFDMNKDKWKLPAPPLHCMLPMVKHPENIKISIETNTSLKLQINMRWTRSDDCHQFGRPKLMFVIKYAIMSNGQDSEIKRLQFLEEQITTNSSLLIHQTIIIKNISMNRWYQFQIEPELKDFVNTGLQHLWYAGIPKPVAAFSHFTSYPTFSDNVKYIIAGCASILILFSLILAAYFAWKANRKWEVPQKLMRLGKNDISEGDIIGEGKFGQVCKATWRKGDSTLETVVVKKLKLEASQQDQLAFREEAIMVSKLESPYIVSTIGICLQSRPIMLVFEYVDGGSLDKYLSDSNIQPLLTAADLLSITKDALEACIYLEDQGYVHRDIAARNCLVSLTSMESRKPKQLKLADFGLAKDVGESSSYISHQLQIIPTNSSAPESLNVPSSCDSKSDVWSFGVLIYEMFSWASVPFGSCKLTRVNQLHKECCPMDPISDNNIIASKVVKSHYNLLKHPLPCAANFNEVLLEIMELCWKFDPKDRPSFHPLKDLILDKSESIVAIQLKPIPPVHAETHRQLKNAYSGDNKNVSHSIPQQVSAASADGNTTNIEMRNLLVC